MKAVGARGVLERPDDLARVVDVARISCAEGGVGIIEGDVSATAFKKTVLAGGVLVRPDDLA